MSLKTVAEKIPGYNRLVLPVHYFQAKAAAKKYQYPAKNLRVIGVTGTNGKTTTSFMIWKMLNQAGHKTGLLTTVGWGGVGDTGNTAPTSSTTSSAADNTSSTSQLPAQPADTSTTPQSPELDATILHQQFEHMTTERVDILNQRMRAIADAGAEFMVLEVTSHALMQYRTLGVPIEIAVFTNLTHEHLDYHKTFANYRKAKLKLFKQSKFGVINADDPNSQYFEDIYSSGDMSTYGIEHGTYRATDIALKPTGVEYSCGDIKVKTQIAGKFNVYNSLAAVAVGIRLGLSSQQISDGIAALSSVEGRMNSIRAGQNFEVIVDYAHTPDALEKVFESIAGTGNRVISVHGGAGRRDESTRALRGEILGKNSDIVIITEDDSRDEDPSAIAQQFVEGAIQAGKVLNQNLFVNLDRAAAIRQAFMMAQPGDLVLLLGKGHEKTILRADGPHPFEDVKVAQALLQELVANQKSA